MQQCHSKLISILILLCLISPLFNTILSQKELIQSGPMLGYADYREVLIWIQTKRSASVKIAYWNETNPKQFTESITTNKDNYFIAKLYPKVASYGATYQYELYINDQKIDFDYKLEFQSLNYWQFRTDPPSIKFAIGSCVYINESKDDRPGNPYGGDYQIFDKILEKDPDFMVWLGDNTYLRTPDIYSKTGIVHRFTHDRALPEMQALLGSVHNYAIWDDHDYGPNDSDLTNSMKKVNEDVFNAFWGNPETNATSKGGITGKFHWGDAEFFLLDNRYHRDPNDLLEIEKSLLGNDQIDWLIKSLKASKAPFKFVCIGGQTVSSSAIFENYENYKFEKELLLKKMNEEQIEGILFFSGDRHHSEISRMERNNAYPLIDFTCSPLTSGTHAARDEGNIHRLPNTAFYGKNFAVIEITGPLKNREMKYMLFDNQGKKIYEFIINESELKYN